MEKADSIKIRLKNVSKHFGAVKALDQITIEFAPGTMTTLLGPSGCGKTTLLRLISGLETVTSGEIWFGGEDVTELSATRRDVGMVFQSYALFPHMTVERNVGYGLRVLKTDPSEVGERVGQALKMVNLDGYQKRHPDELSGGQQQRVAVARAMVLKPKVLLFDEPLSNIDSKLRRSMRDDIRRLQKSSGITSVYVTHDQAEALAVSDEVIVINEGKIEQQGPPKSLYHLPKTAFVANFIGESNVIDAILEKDGNSKWVVLGDTRVQLPRDKKIPAQEGPIKISLRPENMHIKSENQSGIAIEGIISQSAYMGPVMEYSIDTKVGSLFTRAPAYHEQYQPNDKVFLHVNPEELIVIPTVGENRNI
ncbi:MAG: ABC transporter ATP-binding protein [Desulfobacterales bacterium]